MNIKTLRVGSLIRVTPRENQEGLLAVKEIQAETVIAEMISPRKGYLFRVKHDEIQPVLLTDEWLDKLGLTRDDENTSLWHDEGKMIAVESDESGQRFLNLSGMRAGKPVEYVNELQNLYLALTGEDLAIPE